MRRIIKPHFAVACYQCGKQIKTREMITTSPSILMIKLGLDFPKSFHISCYNKAERAAERELRKDQL